MLRLTPRIARPIFRRCISTETATSTVHKLGDMQALGFCNYTPCGLIESVLESMHCTAGLPWWGSIIATTIITRSFLLPIALKAHKNTVKLQNLQPQTRPILLEMQVAKNSQDQEGQKKAMTKMMKLYTENDVNPVRSLLGPLATAPVFMSVFFALKDMAELPVPSLKEGGIGWFSDLTLADPYFILPTLTSLTFLATIEVGVDGGQQQSEKTKKILRIFGLISLPVMATFPAALPLYWLTNNLYSLGFAAAMKSETICRILNVPTRQKGAVMTRNDVEMPGFMDAFQSSVDVAKSGEIQPKPSMSAKQEPIEKRRASGSN